MRPRSHGMYTRKSGPFRNNRLCADTVVKADSEEELAGPATIVVGDGKATDTAGSMIRRADLKCHMIRAPDARRTAQITTRRERMLNLILSDAPQLSPNYVYCKDRYRSSE